MSKWIIGIHFPVVRMQQPEWNTNYLVMIDKLNDYFGLKY